MKRFFKREKREQQHREQVAAAEANAFQMPRTALGALSTPQRGVQIPQKHVVCHGSRAIPASEAYAFQMPRTALGSDTETGPAGLVDVACSGLAQF